MNKLPLISIIVPVYKAENYINDCIDSILAQSFSDFDLILVDDGSPDQCGAICDEYAIKDKRIKVIHKTNGGASTARKAGLEIATSKYIGWVDADDRIAPDMFSILFLLAEKYNADITECQYLLFQGNNIIRSGKEEPIAYGSGNFILEQFFKSKMKPNFVNKLYRSELFNKIQFPKRQIHVDTYVNMRFALMPLTYVRTSEAKYFYILRKNSNITTYNALTLREAIYKYDDTLSLVNTTNNKIAKRYLAKDAINRLMGRYLEISVNSRINNQNIYNFLIRKKLGFSFIAYILTANLPLKTRVSYMLLLANLKSLQRFLHTYLGKKQTTKVP